MMAGSKEYSEKRFKAAKAHARNKIPNPLPRIRDKIRRTATRVATAIVTTLVFIIVVFALILLICLVACGAMHWGIALAAFVILIILIWIAVASMKSYLESFISENFGHLGRDLNKWSDDLTSSLPSIFGESLDVYLEAESN